MEGDSDIVLEADDGREVMEVFVMGDAMRKPSFVTSISVITFLVCRAYRQGSTWEGYIHAVSVAQ